MFLIQNQLLLNTLGIIIKCKQNTTKPYSIYELSKLIEDTGLILVMTLLQHLMLTMVMSLRPSAPDRSEYASREDEYSAGVFVNDDEIQLLVGLDIGCDDDRHLL